MHGKGRAKKQTNKKTLQCPLCEMLSQGWHLKFGHLTVTQNRQPTLFESALFFFEHRDSQSSSLLCFEKKRQKRKRSGGQHRLLRDFKGLISGSVLDLQLSNTVRSLYPLPPILCSTPTLGPCRSDRFTRGRIDGKLEEIISHWCPRTQRSAAFPSRNTPAKKITTHSPVNPRRGERERGRGN